MSDPFPRWNGPNATTAPRQSAVLRLVETATPNAENGPQQRYRPQRVTNQDRRPREHLSRDEVLALCRAARQNRNGARDAAAIWLAFNHGLRVGELAISVGPTSHGPSAASWFAGSKDRKAASIP